MSKIMTMGEILVEIMATETGQSLRRPGLLRGPFASGAPAIFIDQVGKLGELGHSAGMIGCVGDDDFGHLNTERLLADGVDVSAVNFMPGATTGSAFVTYRANGERDFVFNIVHSASGRLGPEHVTAQALAGCNHFHVMGSSLFSEPIIAAMKRAVSLVKAFGGTVSFDPNIRKEILTSGPMREALTHFLAQADIFLPSGGEVMMLVDAATEADAVARILDLGVKEIVVKRGAAGATAYAAGQRFDVGPFAVTEVDPTGAGDCFGGTYVACRIAGMVPADALALANASGALAVTQQGPMEGASTLAQLRAALAQTSAEA